MDAMRGVAPLLSGVLLTTLEAFHVMAGHDGKELVG